MKKRSFILVGAIAATIALGAAGCQDGGETKEYPAYYNPENAETTSEKYVVKVQSEGGMPLNNVKVDAMRGGEVIRSLLTGEGKIDLAVTLGEYSLRVDPDTLPDGYYLPEGWQDPVTNPERRDDVIIKIPSKLLDTPAASYGLGQIMSDFTFTANYTDKPKYESAEDEKNGITSDVTRSDVLNKSYKLSDLMKEKKAVVINFFYTGCGPCRQEFPAVQTAYQKYRDDVELLAICSTHNNDSDATVAKFKRDNGYVFPMGIDTTGLVGAFSVRSFPTTVVIDRYGLIAYISKGSEPSSSWWSAMFDKFTADDYSQSVSSGTGSGDSENGEIKPDKSKPDVDFAAVEASYSSLSGTIAGGADVTFGLEKGADGGYDEYSFPWTAVVNGADSYVRSSNKGADGSYSILHAYVKMNAGDVLSFEYSVSSEQNCDFLYAFIDGQIMNPEGWSACEEWQTANLYVADKQRTVDLTFLYQKDAGDVSGAVGDDEARIRNIHLLDSSAITTPMDVMRPAVSGLAEGAAKYSHYIDVKMYDDGYYHKVNDDKSMGSLLYVSLVNLTAWSDLHTAKATATASDGTVYYNTLYYMTYYLYREGDGENTRFVFAKDDSLTAAIIEAYNIQGWMPAPYYLIPVTQELYLWMNKFISAYEGSKAYEGEWLEMCYYFDHYGAEDGKSFVTFDHTRGMRRGNCYFAYEESDPALAASETKGTLSGNNKAIIEYPLQVNRGTFYKFTAARTGVYQVRSYTTGCSSAEAYPSMFLQDANGRYIGDEISGALDFDQFTGVRYEGFNTYLELEEGQTVYMKTCVDLNEVGYYDFKISYLGPSARKLLVCVTQFGLWESVDRVYAIDTQFVPDADRPGEGLYYPLLADGPDMSAPVYVDFIRSNFMMYGELGYRPLKSYIDAGAFNRFTIGYQNAQKVMKKYYEDAIAKDPSAPDYGMMAADRTLVEILQKLVDYVCEGGGEGNGWLMFACYYKSMGA